MGPPSPNIIQRRQIPRFLLPFIFTTLLSLTLWSPSIRGIEDLARPFQIDGTPGVQSELKGKIRGSYGSR